MMPTGKYKFILKGKGEWFETKMDGDPTVIMSAITQFMVQQFVLGGVPKKDFLELCKKFYEDGLRDVNMKGCE